MKRFSVLISLLLISALLLTACKGGGDSSQTDESVPELSEGEIPEELSRADLSAMDFAFSERDVTASYSDSVTELGTPSADCEITSEGTYVLSGSINDVQIRINAGESDKVQLVLDNAHIANSLGCAIYIGSADKVFITLKEGTENSVSDGSDYSQSDEKSELDGAIFSRADLTVNGSGSLTVNGNLKHGIVSKDDLNIVGTTLTVNAKNVALNGKDCVRISDSELDITAGSDGIRSDNDEDASRGFVYLKSGKLKISSGNDGIQAETAVKIDSGEINIVSGGGSGGRITDSEESYKGIKAASDVVIEDGSFVIDSLDDGIHSNNTIIIKGGDFSLASSDDGIHADTDLSISAGDITVTKSYEGLESSRIFITGGSIDVTASDDGLNAAGGNDQSAGNNPMRGGNGSVPPGGFGGFGGGHGGGFGKDAFDNGVGEIIISGGYLHVDASGDGIDSNGSFALSGGTVLVSGPTNNGNGAFDYGASASVTGGVLVALGSSGMAQGFSEAENQGAMLVNFTNTQAGTSLTLCDENGKAIVSFTPKKSYSSAVITAPEIQQGGKYKVILGGSVEDADENGFACGTSVSGGSTVAEITMDSLLYGNSGMIPGGGDRPGRK